LIKENQIRLTLKVQHEQFFSGNAMTISKSQAGVAKALRMLSFARRRAVKGKSKSINSDR